jgi:hypothetical protein
MAYELPTYDKLKPYFVDKKCHYYHNRSVEKYKEFEPHSEGCYPSDLIECRRPNEPLEVQEYRKQIWKPKTKPTFSRIINSLGKIRRSSDWAIKYPELETFTKIREGESLEDYCEKNFPYFESITNWIFSVVLKKYSTDSNAVELIMPLSTEVKETDYLEPYPVLFDSCDVIEFVHGQYALLNNPLGCTYITKKGALEKGKSFYYIDTIAITQYDQIDAKGTISPTDIYEHGLEMLPCFKLGGIVCETEGHNFLYESRIAGIIPELDEALREYSDLQAAKVLHIYPERWEFTQQECASCKGTGKRRNTAWYDGCDASIPTQVPCDSAGCNSGYIASGPYSKLLIRPTNTIEGSSPIPNPPAGYVEKDVEIVKLMEASVEQHIYNGLAAINFQDLAQVPLAESGVSKQVDRDEQNNTIHAIAEDLVKIMDSTYKITAYYRYKNLYSFEEIDMMLPQIPVPEKYDLLSITNMQTELNSAKTGKTNPVIVNAMEVDYASKRFNTDESVRDMVSLMLKLDPLPNISEDEKMARLSNKGILQETYIVSSNINEFVQRAIDEDPAFAGSPLKDQKKKLLSYATEIINKQSTANAIVSDVLGDSGSVNGGGNDLKQSVGGLTGMIEIAKAVASGLYDLDAAVALVADRFAISEEEARRQLGSPNISNSDSSIDKVAKLT